MTKNETLPFTIGQSVESKSFIKGFRGAWFRSKIKEINFKTGKVLMDYYDYPDNEPEWIDLYKKPTHLRTVKKSHKKDKKSQVKDDRELMIRPCYPPICNRNGSDVAELAVVISDWRLGDLVDWFYNECWWTGKIIELFLSDGKAKVEFLPAPLGEGTVEEVLVKDIRPSLDWSLEGGWTVPTQDSGRACAQLIRPLNPVPAEVVDIKNRVKETEMLTESSSKPPPMSPTTSSLVQKCVGIITVARKELYKVPKQQAELIRTDTSFGTPMKRGAVASHTIAKPDSAVAAVWDLEECLRKVKWLKAVVQDGDAISEDASKPSWEYVK